MRFRYHMVVQDLAGNVVDGASVYVYLAGTGTPAVVYPTRTGERARLYIDIDFDWRTLEFVPI